MYALNSNFSAPHTGIVLAISDLIAPVVFTLASLAFSLVKWVASKAVSLFTPSKKVKVTKDFSVNAPHVALITVPGNFVTGAFKSW